MEKTPNLPPELAEDYKSLSTHESGRIYGVDEHGKKTRLKTDDVLEAYGYNPNEDKDSFDSLKQQVDEVSSSENDEFTQTSNKTDVDREDTSTKPWYRRLPVGNKASINYLIANGIERNPVMEREINPDKVIPRGLANPDKSTRVGIDYLLDNGMDINPVFESKLREGRSKDSETSAEELDRILSQHIENYDINDYMDKDDENAEEENANSNDFTLGVLALPPAPEANESEIAGEGEEDDTDDRAARILAEDQDSGNSSDDENNVIATIPVAEIEDQTSEDAGEEKEPGFFKKHWKKLGRTALALAVVAGGVVGYNLIDDDGEGNDTDAEQVVDTPTEEGGPAPTGDVDVESDAGDVFDTPEGEEGDSEDDSDTEADSSAETPVDENTTDEEIEQIVKAAVANTTSEQLAPFVGLNPSNIIVSGDVMPWTNASGDLAVIQATLDLYNKAFGTNFKMDPNDNYQFKDGDIVIDPKGLENYNLVMQESAEKANS